MHNETDAPVWCVAANVVHERAFGPGGAELRRGTRHFRPGAKVHVIDFFWGVGGDSVTVVGRHRRSLRFMILIMNAGHLANWRAELNYSPHIIGRVLEASEFSGFPRGGPEQRARAEEIARSYIQRGAATQPFVTRPPSSSPADHDEA